MKPVAARRLLLWLGAGSFWRTWLAAWLLLVGLMLCWTVASPLLSSPDEPAHSLRAVSLVRGQLLGGDVSGPGNQALTRVRVPQGYAQPAAIPGCFKHQSEVPAGCAYPAPGSSRLVSTTSSVGRYPPLYYALVGWPSLLTSNPVGFYLMRTLSALENAALLALAFATARRWGSSLLPSAIAVAATPLAIYLSGVINPSGMEITSAILLWTAAVVIVRSHPIRPPRPLIAMAAGATIVLISMRAISLLWPVILAAVLLPVAFHAVDWRRWIRDRWILGCSAAVAVVGIFNLAWIFAANALAVVPNYPVPHSLSAIIRYTTSSLPAQYQQAIGNFGWLDAPAPWLTWQLWTVMAAVLLTIGILIGSRRWRWTLLLTAAVGIVVPIVLGVAEAPSAGYISQGRYWLPILVGVPIVAAGMLQPRSEPVTVLWRVRLFVAVGVAVSQVLCFWWTLHRYLVGMSGPLFGLGHNPSAWHSPVPWYLLDLIVVGLGVLYGRYILRLGGFSSAAPLAGEALAQGAGQGRAG
ncbi:MAG TPA: DUF2142 domain-containing protein [Candidatus Dormibacteraeota bacterium]